MKTTIKNRKGQNIVVVCDINPDAKHLAFVMHGLSGNKEQKHIVAMADAFAQQGFSVVRFDTTNTYGESDGNYEDATLTNYYEDLEDVITWADTQNWHKESVWLAGHSFGGISVAHFAENYPEKVSAVAPISTVVSGKLSIEGMKKYRAEQYTEWEKTGWRIERRTYDPNFVKKLRWHEHKADRLKYDLLPDASKLTMPVLLTVGDQDKSTPLEQQQLLFDTIPEPKELHVISGASHTFYDDEHVDELKSIFTQWIEKYK